MLPMSIGVFVVPRLIASLGASRFGILTIAWTLVGYLSLFDFGVGRSLTKLIAERLGSGDTEQLPRLWSGSLALMTAQGFMGGAVLAVLAPWLTTSVLKIPPDLQHEARISFYVVALIVPIVTSSAGLRGFLEAHGAFPSLNVVKIGLGVCGFLGPLLVARVFPNVALAIMTILASRLIAWGAYLVLCLRISSCPIGMHLLSRHELKMLLRLGGWMTVSNLVSPMMTSLDTFLIGSLLSVSQIQYYSIPADIVTKGLLLSSSLAAVLFPLFSSSVVAHRQHAANVYTRSIVVLVACLAPFALACALLAKPGLTLWLGPQFAERSYHVAQIIAFGVLMNGVASVPFALIQASGRPDLTAKLHLLELPLYAGAVYFLTYHLGIVGTAIAWTGRTTLDAALLLKCSPVRPALRSRPVS